MLCKKTRCVKYNCLSSSQCKKANYLSLSINLHKIKFAKQKPKTTNMLKLFTFNLKYSRNGVKMRNGVHSKSKIIMPPASEKNVPIKKARNRLILEIIQHFE